MSLKGLSGALLVVALVAGVVLVDDAAASHRGSIEERRAEREARRADRDAERAAQRAAREAERAAEEEAEAAQCGCSASLDFVKPDLQWRSGSLVFLPRVDLKVKTKGEAGGPDWSAAVAYSGSVSLDSNDVAVPEPTGFSGSQTIVSGSCGDNRYTFKGVSLGEVSLGGLLRSMFGGGQEAEGLVTMNAKVQGCGFEEEHEASQFTIKDFGDLRTRGWRTVR